MTALPRWQVGAQVVVSPERIPAGTSLHRITIEKSGWPTGVSVLTLIVEISDDDGATWKLDASWNEMRSPWFEEDRTEVDSTALFLGVTHVPESDGPDTRMVPMQIPPGRLMRVRADVMHACLFAARLEHA